MEIKGAPQQMVLCKMMAPRAHRTLEACKQCEYHKGIKATFPGKAAVPPHKGNPDGEKEIHPMYEVLCTLPRNVFVETLIMESIDATPQS